MRPHGIQPPSMATAGDIETLVQRLADRMQADPSDPQGWMLLGRAYAGLQRFDAARDALAEAVKRSPPDAQLLADYADVLAMTQGQRLAGEPERLVLQALALEPDHLKALAKKGAITLEPGSARWRRSTVFSTTTTAASTMRPTAMASLFATRSTTSTAPRPCSGWLTAACGFPPSMR